MITSFPAHDNQARHQAARLEMGPWVGFEPTTSRVRSGCSTNYSYRGKMILSLRGGERARQRLAICTFAILEKPRAGCSTLPMKVSTQSFRVAAVLMPHQVQPGPGIAGARRPLPVSLTLRARGFLVMPSFVEITSEIPRGRCGCARPGGLVPLDKKDVQKARLGECANLDRISGWMRSRTVSVTPLARMAI